MRILNSIIPKELPVLLLFSVVLVLGRIGIFHTTHYVYLLWNVFLACIPLSISIVLGWYISKETYSTWIATIGFIAWLVTFPNAPYIVTDLIHLGHGYMAHMLYDTILLFTVAWVGLSLGFHSLRMIEKILHTKYSSQTVSIIRIFIILLSSLGIYLGRFARFNSWDIIIHPFQLCSFIYNVIVDPFTNLPVYVVTIVSFIFIYTTYTAWQYQTKSYV